MLSAYAMAAQALAAVCVIAARYAFYAASVI